MIIAPSSARTRVVITTPSERLGIAIRRGELEGIVICQAAVESPLLAPTGATLWLWRTALSRFGTKRTRSLYAKRYTLPSQNPFILKAKLRRSGGPTGPAFWRFGETLASARMGRFARGRDCRRGSC